MAWISIAAQRGRFRRQATESRTAWLERGSIDFSNGALLVVWLGGDEEAILQQEEIVARPTHLTPKVVARPPEWLFATLADSLLLRRAAGEDVVAELKRLSDVKGYTDKAVLIVQRALKRIATGKPLAAVGRSVAYPESEADLRKLADRSPLLGAQLALVPDGKLWGRVTGIAITLAYEALASSGAEPDLPQLRSLIRAGGDPRPRVLVYERHGEGSSGVWREDTSVAPGFDAVEVTDDAVIVHHYMGVRWHAPLLFDNDVNAFQFLAHLDAGWAIVEGALDAPAWSRLSLARANRRTVHRVSIDPVNACEDPASTARARDRYGVDIEVVGFLSA